jgi:hypothetical protein
MELCAEYAKKPQMIYRRVKIYYIDFDEVLIARRLQSGYNGGNCLLCQLGCRAAARTSQEIGHAFKDYSILKSRTADLSWRLVCTFASEELLVGAEFVFIAKELLVYPSYVRL